MQTESLWYLFQLNTSHAEWIRRVAFRTVLVIISRQKSHLCSCTCTPFTGMLYTHYYRSTSFWHPTPSNKVICRTHTLLLQPDKTLSFKPANILHGLILQTTNFSTSSSHLCRRRCTHSESMPKHIPPITNPLISSLAQR